jgi:hypothetical protein
MLSEPILYELLVFTAGAATVSVAAYVLVRLMDAIRRPKAPRFGAEAGLEERLDHLEAVMERTVREVRQLALAQRFTLGLLERSGRDKGMPGLGDARGVTPH